MNSIKKYKSDELIKADNGESLRIYWKNEYLNDEFYKSKNDLLDSFIKCLEEVKLCHNMLKSNIIFEKYVIMIKLEIFLIHCLVLNEILNEIDDEHEDVFFSSYLIMIKKNKRSRVVLEKIENEK